MKPTRTRRIFAMLLTLMLIAALLPMVSAAPGDTTTLARWSSTAGTAYTGVYAATSTLSVVPSSTISYSTTYYGLYCSGWSTSKYWQIVTSSIGYEQINVSFWTRGSATGPKNFMLQYSTDGVNFIDVQAYSLAAANTNYSHNITLPEGANNAETLTLRFRVTDSTSVDGGYIASAGTNYMGNPIISGIEAEPAAEWLHAHEVQLVFVNAGVQSVQISKKLDLGAGLSFNPEINMDNYTLTWESKNTTVATVNAQGVLTGKKAGMVIITATLTCPDGCTNSISFSVKVY